MLEIILDLWGTRCYSSQIFTGEMSNDLLVSLDPILMAFINIQIPFRILLCLHGFLSAGGGSRGRQLNG